MLGSFLEFLDDVSGAVEMESAGKGEKKTERQTSWSAVGDGDDDDDGEETSDSEEEQILKQTYSYEQYKDMLHLRNQERKQLQNKNKKG